MEEVDIDPEQRLSTTTVMAIAATGAALLAMFGEPGAFGPITVVFALAGLLPWALAAGGVRLHPTLFLLATAVPAAIIVLVDRNPGGVFPMMLTVVWLTRLHARGAVALLAVGSATAVVVALAVLEGTTHETGTIYFVGGIGVAWLAGSMIGRQERLVAQLRAAQARQAKYAVDAERTHIAREVHDVVAHSLTVTMLHVTGARRVLVNDPARAAEALDRAEVVGRESLDSIRQIVGLLRTGDDGESGSAPLPEITDITDLIDQYRGAGLRVSGDVRLDGVVADAATSLTAFRVVQESLANVLQHAPGAPVELVVAGDLERSILRIVAENPTASNGASRRDRVGLGLRGMGERVRAAGGSIEVGPVAGGNWRVDASLPLRAVAAQ